MVILATGSGQNSQETGIGGSAIQWIARQMDQQGGVVFPSGIRNSADIPLNPLGGGAALFCHFRIDQLCDQPETVKVSHGKLNGADGAGEPGVVFSHSQSVQKIRNPLGSVTRRHEQITARI